MSGLCKDCRFWKPWEEERGECRLTNEFEEGLPEAKFWALPWQGADGGVVGTFADYGCNQFEEKGEG